MSRTFDIYDHMLKIAEAHCVRLGVDVNRRYSDADLAPALRDLSMAELEGVPPSDSELEFALLGVKHKNVYDVSVTGGATLDCRICADNAYQAVEEVIGLIVIDGDIPVDGVSIKVKRVQK